MAVLSKLALRPDYPYASDRPTVYVIEGETFVAFGSMTPEQFWDGVGRRRFEHPSFKEFSLFLDYATPDLPQDPYIPLDSPFEDDPEQDPIEFVLNDDDEMHIYESPEGTYRIKLDWKDNYFVLQRKLDKCNLAILDQPPGGHKLAMGTSERDLLEIRTLHRSRRHAEDILWKLKGAARNNLGLLNYLTHTLTWWQEALEEDDCAFVRSLNLPLRPKRGCLVNPLSDWSFLNIPLLRQHDVPFAYVWSEAVNAQPRFARLDPKFVQGYYQVKEELGREPRPEEIPVIASGDRDALYFDHLLQDKRKRTKGSMARDYQPGSSYVLQMHEGWKGVELDDPAAIQRCLDRYEHYAERSTNGEERVVIEAWSLRDSDEQSVGATFELGPVASQSALSDRIGERADISVYERREMYRLSCAPWGGAQYDAATGELREAVDLNKETALADLEKLFYPREAELAHSLPPPGLEETPEDSDPSMDISPGDRASAGAGRSRASTPVLLRRMAVPPHAQMASPPTTHDSWRTDRASELGLNEGGRRSASPRRGVRVPEGSSNLTMPDPSRIRRSDIATPSSANWGQRFRLFQASFVPLLAQLSPRPYPRFEDEFFDLAWEEQFVQYGYLRIPDDADRVRVILWLETQDFSGPRQLLHLCLAAGIRIHLGYRTDAPLPDNAKEIAGPIPEHHESEYLSFGDGGTELYASYRGMVQDLCRREYAPSFLCYGGFVSAIAAKYGRDIIKDRLKEGLSLPARFHKLGQVEHPYGVYPEVLVERPPPRDVNKLLGMVIGKDGNKKYWLYPPPPLWESLWPGNGEWNYEEEQYFLDLYAGWEKGARSPWSMKRWKDHLEGLAHKMRDRHPDRVAPSMSVRTARDWAILFDLVYGVEDATIALRDLGSSFRAQKLPLFR